MNVKLFATNCFFVLFLTKNICSASTVESQSIAIPDSISGSRQDGDLSSITFGAGFDEILLKEGVDSWQMFINLFEKADKPGVLVYNVKINVVKDKKYLKSITDPEFDRVLAILQRNFAEDPKTALLKYLQVEKLKLVVRVTDSDNKPFNFLVEEKKLTPVPAHLLPENQKPVSDADKFNVNVVIGLLIGIIISSALAYGYIQYKGPADEDEL